MMSRKHVLRIGDPNRMLIEPDTICADLGYERLMATIYGWGGHNGSAARKPVRDWKRELVQLFGTVRTAIEKNVTGDDRHKEQMMERSAIAATSIRRAKTKEDVAMAATQFAFELIFQLLGQLPNNWQARKAHHSRVTDLSSYRTLGYTRTARQRVREILDYVCAGAPPKEWPSWDRLVEKLNRDFSGNPHRFLLWLKSEHNALYCHFN